MSDTIPVQHESAVVVLREMEAEVAAEIQSHTDRLLLANAKQDMLLDAIARLTRKPRARKPRIVTEATEPGSVDLPALPVLGRLNIDNPADPKNKEIDLGSRPTVFATPSSEVANAA